MRWPPACASSAMRSIGSPQAPRPTRRNHSAPYDAAVLDLGLPGTDGMVWLRSLARSRLGPAGAYPDGARRSGSSASPASTRGADDYLIKPIATEELAARLRAMLRRATGRAQSEWRTAPCVYDTVHQGRSTGKAGPVELTAREVALARGAPEASCSGCSPRRSCRSKLYDWSGREPESNTLEVHVHRLRRKIHPDIVRTVRGVGYALGAEVAAEPAAPPAGVPAPVGRWSGASRCCCRTSRARHEVNELFDTEIIRLACQVQATLLRLGRRRRIVVGAGVVGRCGRPARPGHRRLERRGQAGRGRPGRRDASPARQHVGLRRPDARRGRLAGLLPAVGARLHGWWQRGSRVHERDELGHRPCRSQLVALAARAPGTAAPPWPGRCASVSLRCAR